MFASLIVKILVVTIFWCIIGFIAIASWAIRIALYWIKTDPENEQLPNEILCNLYDYIGLRFDKSKKISDINKEVGKIAGGTGLSRAIYTIFTWPKTMAFVTPIFNEIINRIDQEYKTGIRVRKEKGVS